MAQVPIYPDPVFVRHRKKVRIKNIKTVYRIDSLFFCEVETLRDLRFKGVENFIMSGHVCGKYKHYDALKPYTQTHDVIEGARQQVRLYKGALNLIT